MLDSWLALVAHHAGQLVGLALQRQGRALDLLVVLQLQLEEADHLDGRSGGPGDGDARVVVGGEHLLDGAVADQVAGGGPAVTGHDHAVGVPDGHHRGAVGDLQVVGVALGGGPGQTGSGEQPGEVRAGVVAGVEAREHRPGG
jgi:hypothetical protein